MEKLKKRIARLLPAICMVCLLLSASSCMESNEEWRYKRLQEAVEESDIPDSLKSEIRNMRFKEFLKTNPLKRETAKLHEKACNEQAIGDSIWAGLISLKEAELEPVREKYRNKTEILRIRRIWLNGNLLPWTYHAWLSVSYRLSGSYRGYGGGGSMFGSLSSHGGIISGKITPDMEGQTQYTGETKLDYINVVFSDNSYERFLIKDNPGWLLAKEGEKVERRYEINNYKAGTDVGQVLEEAPFDLVVYITYVPLFK